MKYPWRTQLREKNEDAENRSSARVQTQRIPLDTNDPVSWVINHHYDNLVTQVRKPRKRSDNVAFRVSFAELQRMYLRKLQCKLVKHVIDMRYKDSKACEWETDLKEYVQAMKDYDYMLACRARDTDPFLATGERAIDNYVIKMTLRDTPPGNLSPVYAVESWEPETGSEPIGGTRSKNDWNAKFKSFQGRVVIATVAGAFLIGPMWFMVLHKSLYTALICTTVCVVLLGLLMAWRLDQPHDVMLSTAAYAAVLVVFVGLNTSS